jgi:hypothetical protein
MTSIRKLRLLAVGAVLATLALGSTAAGPAPDSAAEVTPLLIGAEVPDSDLRTLDGKEVKLRTALEGDPAVILFYRGGW